MNQHSRGCENKPSGRVSSTTKESATAPELLIPPKTNRDEDRQYTWGWYHGKEFKENVSFVCEQVVYWKRNLFLLPTGKAGELYVDQTSKILNAWTNVSPQKKIAMKAIMIMPSFLL